MVSAFVLVPPFHTKSISRRSISFAGRAIVGDEWADRARVVVLKPAEGRVSASYCNTEQSSRADTSPQTVVIAGFHGQSSWKAFEGARRWLVAPGRHTVLSTSAQLVDLNAESGRSGIWSVESEGRGLKLILTWEVEPKLTDLITSDDVKVEDGAHVICRDDREVSVGIAHVWVGFRDWYDEMRKFETRQGGQILGTGVLPFAEVRRCRNGKGKVGERC